MRDEVWLCDANLSLSWHPLLLCSALTSFPSPLTSCFARHLVSFHTITSPLFPQHMSWTPPLSPSTQPSISLSIHWRRNTRNYQHSSISNSLPSHLCLFDIAPISHFASSPPPSLLLFLCTHSLWTSSSPASSWLEVVPVVLALLLFSETWFGQVTAIFTNGIQKKKKKSPLRECCKWRSRVVQWQQQQLQRQRAFSKTLFEALWNWCNLFWKALPVSTED